MLMRTQKRHERRLRQYARNEAAERQADGANWPQRLRTWIAGFRYAAGRDPSGAETPPLDAMFRLYDAWAAGWSCGRGSSDPMPKTLEDVATQLATTLRQGGHI